MNNRLLRLYYRLPTPLRTAAASARGLYLRRWRYGPESERLVLEALERDTWTRAKWTKWQEERLAYMLHHAATRVPYYRAQWAERRRRGDRASWDYLENWPVLEKDAVRQDARAFVADDQSLRQLELVHTSGSTGKPLRVWWSRSSVRSSYALIEARCRRWNNTSLDQPWATIGGQLVADVGRTTPPFWVWNGAVNQLYMSSYHLAPAFTPHCLDALEEYEITHLYAYTSAIYALALEVLHRGRSDLKMTVVLTNAEPLYAYQRTAIERAFQCPVRETYGMAEGVISASEDSRGDLRLWPEMGWLEILENDQPVGAGRTGDLVGTSLLKDEMPLIRYRVGDRGSLPASEPASSGDCTLPFLQEVAGRIDDVLFTADGRRIGRLDPVFKSDLPIREAQIVQEALDHVRVYYVPTAGTSAKAAATMERRVADELRARMGSLRVTCERVDTIARGPNGKLRAVVCNLTEDQKPPFRTDACISGLPPPPRHRAMPHSPGSTTMEQANDGIVIREARAADLDQLVEIHMEAFSDQRSALLGRSYVLAGHRWFLHAPDAVNLVAVEAGRVLGFVEGAPHGYARSKDRATRWAGVFALSKRPWLLLDPYFRLAVGYAIRRLLNRPVPGAPDPSTHPARFFGLVSIAVAEKGRGKGIAGVLMRAFEQAVRRRGFSCMRLTVKRTNEAAIRAYQKAGWQRLESSIPYGEYYMKTIGEG